MIAPASFDRGRANNHLHPIAIIPASRRQDPLAGWLLSSINAAARLQGTSELSNRRLGMLWKCSFLNVSHRGQLAVALNLLEGLVKAWNIRGDARRS